MTQAGDEAMANGPAGRRRAPASAGAAAARCFDGAGGPADGGVDVPLPAAVPFHRSLSSDPDQGQQGR